MTKESESTDLSLNLDFDRAKKSHTLDFFQLKSKIISSLALYYNFGF